MSGFTGSAGLCVVTDKEAALWTDGRYFLQASKQLDPGHWILQKSGMPGVPSKEEWLNTVLPLNAAVGVDPKLITVAACRTLKESLTKTGRVLELVHQNLVDLVWTDKPAIPRNPVFSLDVKYTGMLGHLLWHSLIYSYLQPSIEQGNRVKTSWITSALL